MKDVELKPGFQWAEPFPGREELEVKAWGQELQITGRLPSYLAGDHPSDLLRQYELAPKNRSKKRTGKDSPHIRFANADTDDKLIAFVRTFGPVVAKSFRFEPEPPFAITARQDLIELRTERLVYRAALSLIQKSSALPFDYFSARELIAEIAKYIQHWPEQWNREKSERNGEPMWKLSTTSLRRIEQLSLSPSEAPFPKDLDSRIVICELLNAFQGRVFPNPAEMHSSIRYGIRPLLYSILRREFVYPAETAVCANTNCRDFFKIERAGQRFCTPECSRHQRQREYFQKRGRKLRRKRLKNRAK